MKHKNKTLEDFKKEVQKRGMEKDDEGHWSKNSKFLREFVEYCLDNPELRFWQALRGWSGAESILYHKGSSTLDTFYLENKTPLKKDFE